MCAILIDIKPGDEVILPSYTFVSTANAFVLRGAVPVFVDIDPFTLNISPKEIQSAITAKTKAVVVVHYAGKACDMRIIMSICQSHNIYLIEDAAQAILSYSSDCEKYLGTIGHLGCLSFHETKNIICGEGGALLVNDSNLIERAQIIQEKGTDRTKFLLGFVDKYTWRELGSSYYPSEITAAFLYAQLEEAHRIILQRKSIWKRYHEALSSMKPSKFLLPYEDYSTATNNAHIYYLLAETADARRMFIEYLKCLGIMAVFHYVPLHASYAGQKYGRTHGSLNVTQTISDTLIRLPLWVGLDPLLVCQAIDEYL